MKTTLLLTMLIVLLAGCGDSSSKGEHKIFDAQADPVTSGSWYKPNVQTSWEIQLQGDLKTNYDVTLYDVDLFDTSVTTIQALKNSGRKVICYFSAGSYEDWRIDKDTFPPEVLGNTLAHHATEKWLDISNVALAPVMQARLDLAVQKGCDGVDPDNMDGYANDTGFELSMDDQLAYDIFIANEARKRGLSVGLKNNLNQITKLEPYYDFSINEQCHRYNECDMLLPFIQNNKPVFSIEYNQIYLDNQNQRDIMCANSNALGLQTLVLPKNLDGSFRYSCN